MSDMYHDYEPEEYELFADDSGYYDYDEYEFETEYIYPEDDPDYYLDDADCLEEPDWPVEVYDEEVPDRFHITEPDERDCCPFCLKPYSDLTKQGCDFCKVNYEPAN